MRWITDVWSIGATRRSRPPQRIGLLSELIVLLPPSPARLYRLSRVSPSPRLSAVIAIISSNEPTAPLQCGSEEQPDRRS